MGEIVKMLAMRPLVARWPLAVVLVASVGLSAACASGGGKTPSAKPSTAPPSLTARQVAESDALAAYTNMWMAVAKAGETANPDDPEVERYSSEKALAYMTNVLLSQQVWGQVTKGRPELHPQATSATPQDAPTEVQVADCSSDAKWLKYKKTGELFDDVPGGTHQVTATVKLVGGLWKVATIQIGKVGSC